jgi:hypothetical protein
MTRGMKRLGALVVIALCATPAAAADTVRLGSKVSADCTFEGKKLQGRVKVVDAFADFEVKVVDAFPDLRVMTVDAFPDSCGRWQMVDAFPDFTIKYVDAFSDFDIKRVDAFAGLP